MQREQTYKVMPCIEKCLLIKTMRNKISFFKKQHFINH